MIKKLLFLGGAVLLLAALFAGPGLISYATTAVDKVEHQFKSSVPVKFEIERARRMLKDLKPEIERNMHLIAREEVEIAKLERERRGIKSRSRSRGRKFCGSRATWNRETASLCMLDATIRRTK